MMATYISICKGKIKEVNKWLYMLIEILLLNHVWTLEVLKKVNLSHYLLKLY